MAHQPVAMYLVSVNSSSPSYAPSRPIPDCFTRERAARSETRPAAAEMIEAGASAGERVTYPDSRLAGSALLRQAWGRRRRNRSTRVR